MKVPVCSCNWHYALFMMGLGWHESMVLFKHYTTTAYLDTPGIHFTVERPFLV